MKTKQFLGLAILAVSVPALSACSIATPGHLNQKRVEIHEDKFYQDVPASDVTADYLAQLAGHYNRYGDGPVYASVVYDPKSRNATAMQATQKASEISQVLRLKGVKDLKVDIMPVNEAGSEMRVVIGFMTYTAHAPRDCGVLSGFEDLEHNTDKDYDMGCTLETVFARQISRPKDFLGGTGIPAERSAMGVDGTATPALMNTPNPALGGESSSE